MQLKYQDDGFYEEVKDDFNGVDAHNKGFLKEYAQDIADAVENNYIEAENIVDRGPDVFTARKFPLDPPDENENQHNRDLGRAFTVLKQMESTDFDIWRNTHDKKYNMRDTNYEQLHAVLQSISKIPDDDLEYSSSGGW